MKCRHLQTNLTPEKREKETVAWNFLAREWKNSLLAPGRRGRAAEGGARQKQMLGTLDSIPGESDWEKTGTSCTGSGPVIPRNGLMQPKGLCFIKT